TLAASLMAAVRGAGARPDPGEPIRLHLRPLEALSIAVAALLVGGSLWLARTPAVQQVNQTYSLLWAVPAAGSGPQAIRVGVRSAESDTRAFIVRVVAGTEQLQEFPVQLAPAQVWETELTPTGVPVSNLEVQLSRADTPDVVYRRVALRTGD
ncbi:MAG: hypothetical protein M3069_05255, partial [Chloroflexota bacterium]|nr:hypothetical protein [Chloroflexota bacterium]